jgi:hypothetical protein
VTEEDKDVSLDPLAEQTRRGLELVKPRALTNNPRCPDCWSGPMMHIAHVWGPCQMRDIGSDEVCSCTRSPGETRDYGSGSRWSGSPN